FHTETLYNGVYLININQLNNSITKKVIINK
ncbi:MAG: T9SS C-terminal target domain-containing protein, partial [Flavobacteriales bacterium TMED191]